MFEDIYHLPVEENEPLPFSLPEWIAVAPFEEYLGMEILHASGGKATLTMPFLARLCQGKGLMHGGAVTALADTALAMAIKSLLPVDTHFVTIELSLKFHAPVKGGTVRAEAQVTERSGRHLAGEAHVYTQDGTLCATFKARFKVKNV